MDGGGMHAWGDVSLPLSACRARGYALNP
jgi:hypothetical protein